MPQTNNEWYQAGPQEFYRYFDPYPDQERRERAGYPPYVGPYPEHREEEGQVTAAQANVIMLTPYLRNLYRRRRGTGWIPVEYPVRR